MRLVCNKTYEVGVLLRPTKSYSQRRAILSTHLVYCGGSYVDAEGHHVGGGVWADRDPDHRTTRYFYDLHVVYIHESKDQRTSVESARRSNWPRVGKEVVA